MSRQKASVALTVFFILCLIANIPAAILYGAVKNKLPGVELTGLSGSWTSGEVTGITLQNRLLGQKLHFRLQLLPLFLGRLSYRVSGGGEIGNLDGVVSRSLGSTGLRGLTVRGNLKRLASTTGYGFLPLDGEVDGQIGKLLLVKGALDTAEAKLDVKNLAWTLARDPMLLGDFHADVETTPQAIIAKISSPSGPLEAKGDARLFPDHRYELDVLIKLKPGATEMLSNYVRSLGPPDAQGYTHLRQKGTL